MVEPLTVFSPFSHTFTGSGLAGTPEELLELVELELVELELVELELEEELVVVPEELEVVPEELVEPPEEDPPDEQADIANAARIRINTFFMPTLPFALLL